MTTKLPCAAGPEFWFPKSSAKSSELQANEARHICRTRCPIVFECLEQALKAEGGCATDGRSGIFGGMTPKERYNLHRVRVKNGTATANTAPCGTNRGYRRHLRDGEKACQPCRNAALALNKASKTRQAA